MKKFFKLLTVCFVICTIFTQAAFAASLTLTGTADTNTKGVTILVLRKGTDGKNFSENDIVYINQSKINSDGSFSLTLPFLEKDDYDFFSNTKFGITEDTTGLLDVAYVSSNGSDANDGTIDNPFATMSKAYNMLKKGGKIVIKDNAAFVPATKAVTIEGSTSSAQITLGSEVSLGNVHTFKNITLSGTSTIYANGYSLTVEESVITTDRLSVYGGKKNGDLTGNTSLTLLGGKYNDIYGGGYAGKVTGNTTIILGGNANAGEGIDDDNTSTLSPCMVYGGGNNGAVTGKTEIILQGNAVAKYIVGAGTGTNGTAKDTNINIEGGKVMNVYGGSRTTVLPEGTQTHVKLTGGIAEAIFGGCEAVSLTGDTFVQLLGGQVTRRVYSGCYNDVSFGMSGLSIVATWKNSNHVTGTTNLIIGPDVKLNTKTGLSSDNSINVGVFAGSRMESQSDDEQNTILYINGAASSHSTYIGEKSTYMIVALNKYLKSWEDYTIKASKNGKVYATNKAGVLDAYANSGYVLSYGGKEYESTTVTVSAGTHELNFIEKDFLINSVTAGEPSDAGLTGSANIFANNRAGKEEPRMIVAIYDENNALISTDTQYVTKSNANQSFNLTAKLEKGETYIVKAMIWDKNHNPLTTSYVLTLK